MNKKIERFKIILINMITKLVNIAIKKLRICKINASNVNFISTTQNYKKIKSDKLFISVVNALK